MGDLAYQYKLFGRAEQYVTAGERLLANLVAHFDEMSARGEDTAELSNRLRLFQDILEKWQALQQEALDAIQHLEGAVRTSDWRVFSR